MSPSEEIAHKEHIQRNTSMIWNDPKEPALDLHPTIPHRSSNVVMRIQMNSPTKQSAQIMHWNIPQAKWVGTHSLIQGELIEWAYLGE